MAKKRLINGYAEDGYSGNIYPHMCRMDHEEIGHSDSNNERCPVCRRDDALTAAHSRIAALEAKLAKREAQLVWAVRHGAELEGDRVWWFRMLGEDSGVVDIECDGTPAGLLAAIDAATEER